LLEARTPLEPPTRMKRRMALEQVSMAAFNILDIDFRVPQETGLQIALYLFDAASLALAAMNLRRR